MACGVEKSALHCLCGFLTRSDWKKRFCHRPAESFRQHVTKQKKTNTHLSQKRLHVVLRLVLLSTLNYHLGGAVKYVAVAKEPVSKFGAHPLTWICLYSSLAWRSAYSSIVIETKKEWHKDLQFKDRSVCGICDIFYLFVIKLKTQVSYITPYPHWVLYLNNTSYSSSSAFESWFQGRVFWTFRNLT